MGLLEGKKALIFGVANERSIAWAIARALKNEGAECAFTYATERLKERVENLAHSVGSDIVLPCDVTKDEEIETVFSTVKDRWQTFDVLIHSVAFAKKEELKGKLLDTSREGFQIAMDVSVYSLIALTKEAAPLMQQDGSIITLTYLGSQKVVPNYNVMGVAKAGLEATVRYLAEDMGPQGVRVNAISAGPVKTLAAMGISGFGEILKRVEEKAPLRRNITQEDVSGVALFLASPLSRGVTGEIIYVDSGYNIMGL